MACFRHAVLGSLLLGSLAPLACAGDDGNGDPPCAVKVAFVLSVRAVSGELPADTRIKVQYGGGVEEFRLDSPDPSLEVLLCTATSADAGVDASDGAASDAADDGGTPPPDAGSSEARVERIECKLWAQGAATVTVTASGYPDLTRDLEADGEEGCFKTVDVDLVLGDEDAGT